jgi:hypothetical protein
MMAGHVVGGTVVEVPSVELVLARANVEVGMGSRFLDVGVGGGLGAEA